MTTMAKETLVLFLILQVMRIGCQNMDSPAYSRYSGCKPPSPEDDIFVTNFTDKAILALEPSSSKGFLGTVGIVGGSHIYTGKPYFAALSALRVGADAVHIFCLNIAGSAIQSMSPNIIVHPILDINFEKTIVELNKMDIILLGPGLDESGHSVNVITRVINQCKASKKPLILHLDEFFLTQATVNLLSKYPSPGVIMITNSKQFEKIYTFIKRGNPANDYFVQINFDNLENFMIMRTGCTDAAMSASPLSSWSNSREVPLKRTTHEDELISGAVATYFYWAIKVLMENDTADHGPMLPAAVATYSASNMVRKISKLAVEEIGFSASTLDMVEKIHEVLYGME